MKDLSERTILLDAELEACACAMDALVANEEAMYDCGERAVMRVLQSERRRLLRAWEASKDALRLRAISLGVETFAGSYQAKRSATDGRLRSVREAARAQRLAAEIDDPGEHAAMQNANRIRFGSLRPMQFDGRKFGGLE